MVFNLNELRKNDSVLITNTDESFIGTELAKEPFAVRVKRISKVDQIDMLQLSQDDDGNFSNGLYSMHLFIRSITEVEGFFDSDGNKLGLEEDIREIIWEHGDVALIDKIKDTIQGFTKKEQKKSE